MRITFDPVKRKRNLTERGLDFLDAGAVAVFAGSDLVSPAMVESEQYDEVLTRAAGYVAAVAS